MYKVGITGGIGSGKSVVCRIFSELGIPVYNADEAAKSLMNEDGEIKEKILLAFGKDAYTEAGLNRGWLAERVFQNENSVALLNSIVHPIIIAHAEQWMMAVTSPYAIKEAALFFESGSAAGLDFIIGVSAPRYLRMQRAMQRDGSSKAEIQARMDRQIDENIKMKLCDAVIMNDEVQMVLPQVLALHQQLLQNAAAHS